MSGQYSLSKYLAAAAAVVLNACEGALKYIGAMHGDDARTWFPTTGPHAFYDGRKRNRSPGIARDDSTAIEIAIDDDGLPARPAVPWLPIPRGLGRAVRDNPDLPKILRLSHDHAASSNAWGIKPAHLRYCMEEDGTIAPSHRRHRR